MAVERISAYFEEDSTVDKRTAVSNLVEGFHGSIGLGTLLTRVVERTFLSKNDKAVPMLMNAKPTIWKTRSQETNTGWLDSYSITKVNELGFYLE